MDNGIFISSCSNNPYCVSESGNRLQDVPLNAGALWLKYSASGPWNGLSVGGGVVAVGERAGDNQNDYALPGYARIDSMIQYRWIPPAETGAKVQTMTKLTVEARLSAQLVGIEFAIEYVTVAGKRAWFSIGTAERVAEDTFELVWDMSKKMPADRDKTALDVTLAALAVAAAGSKLWEKRDTPRALLPVHLEVPI